MIIGILILMVISSLGLAALSWCFFPVENLKIVLVDAFVQLAVIGGVGILIDLAFKRSEESRANDERDNALRLDLLKRLRTAHAEVARAWKLIEWHKTSRTYGIQLRNLMIVQSEINEILAEIRTYKELFGNSHSDVACNVEKIVGYLNKGIEEYGEKYKAKLDKTIIGDEYKRIEAQHFPWVSDFVAQGNCYKEGYVTPLTDATQLMRMNIRPIS